MGLGHLSFRCDHGRHARCDGWAGTLVECTCYCHRYCQCALGYVRDGVCRYCGKVDRSRLPEQGRLF